MAFVYAVGIFLVSLLVTTNDACWGGNPPVVLRATCNLTGSITGTLKLGDCGTVLKVEGSLVGVPPGEHAIHVHVNGNVSDNCNGAGPHYNPTNVDHGAPDAAVRHTGDWGNFNASGNPYKFSLTDKVAKLRGDHSIMGRGIVIHAGVDDLGLVNNNGSRLNGNAGPRLACCVITPAP